MSEPRDTTEPREHTDSGTDRLCLALYGETSVLTKNVADLWEDRARAERERDHYRDALRRLQRCVDPERAEEARASTSPPQETEG